MSKITCLLAFLSLWHITVCHAGGPVPIQKGQLNQGVWNLVENKGQLADEQGNPISDIKYYGQMMGAGGKSVTIFCKPTRISFVFASQEKPISPISEATGMAAHTQPQMPQPGKWTSGRADMVLTHANASAPFMASDLQPYYENFYLAQASEEGITHVATYQTLTYKDIYPHIDLVLYTRHNGLKYEFVVHPKGKVSDIQVQWEGLKNMTKAQNGGIRYETSISEIQESAPVCYQKAEQQAHEKDVKIGSAFTVNHRQLGFVLGKYDPKKDLVIDPNLLWSSYFGDSGLVSYDQGIATDPSGNVFMCTYTSNPSSLASSGAYQTSYGGDFDAFLVKFSASGQRLWSTFYGGKYFDDSRGVVCDASGNAYMSGQTSSPGLGTSGTYQSAIVGGDDNYIVKFNPSGSRVWATYFGEGDELERGMGTDSSGNFYMTGVTMSVNGLATTGAYQTSLNNTGGIPSDFIAKFDPSGSLSWCTYFGGPGQDYGQTITADRNGNVICTGSTFSGGLATSGAYNTSYSSGAMYLASFTSGGNLSWCTYLPVGLRGLTTDNKNNIIVSGYTLATSKGLATSGAYQTSMGGGSDGVILKFNTSGSLQWGTYFGANGDENAICVATDEARNIFVGGTTTSTYNIATAGAYQTAEAGGTDGFLARFSENGSKDWCTYFGDAGDEDIDYLSLDRNGNIAICGPVTSSSGLATSGVYETSTHNGSNLFVAVFGIANTDAGISAITSPGNAFCPGTRTVSAKLENYGIQNLDSVKIGWSVNHTTQAPYSWTGTLVHDSTVSITLGSYTFPAGDDVIKVWTYAPNGITDSFAYNDTTVAIASVNPNFSAHAGGNHSICMGNTDSLGSNSITGHSYSWASSPAGFSSSTANPTVTPTTTMTYYLNETITATGCMATDSAKITVNPLPVVHKASDQTICQGATVTIGTTAYTGYGYAWTSRPTGFTSTNANPSVTPSVSTVYYVTETYSPTGCHASDSVTITVNPIPTAHAGGNHSICARSTLTIGASSVGGHTYSWVSIPSGFSSTLANPSVNPTLSTKYYVTEMITSSGCSAIDSAILSVSAAPHASFSYTSTCPNDSIPFSNSSTSATSVSWDFGDGSTSTLSNPQHLYAATGTYLVKLKAYGSSGCNDSATTSVSVSACVWPGDANNDKTVDMSDLLAIGIGYGVTGPARPSANITWSGQPAAD